MLVQNLFLAVALSATGLAIDVDDAEVPYQCRDVCIPVIRLTSSCDAQIYDNDQAELACICDAANASTQIPTCEACVSQYDDDGPDNEFADVNDLVRKCGFAYTTYNTASPSATAAPSAPASSMAPSSAPPASTSPAAAAPAQSTGTGSGSAPTGGAGFNGTGTPGAPVPPFNSPTQSVAPQNTDNAAPAPTIGAVGVGLGVLGFALGML
ncbi:hypothetical protein BU26DRAFT_501824 [Trematosphaeria pertusa]|uniref:Extracellular membrane protein CFEM domain-containing protein n=1 Tax=Trematosphaeria pertusa TaxID=390896 RepID=A0A6A6IU84_9PLEO|nr:uncharacterized protein BU26DRAFT_501824 [Trematosphaeria pertusa]KAF2253677.1 hypothetical protein BU26DRAFT_501824 [Trematosphaeria pertusa]